MERALNSFLHISARRIMGRQPRRGKDGKWFKPPLEGAMKEAGFKDVRTSINTRQNRIAQYITTQPLLDLCEGTTQIGGASVAMGWWDQKGIDWKKAKARGAETESESESESETDMEEEEARNSDSGESGSSGAEWSGASVDQWELNAN